MANGTIAKTPSKVYYEDFSIGEIASNGAGSKTFSFTDQREKDAIWFSDVSNCNRVGVVYMIRRGALTDSSVEIWYYNTRNAAAGGASVRVFYTLA